MSEKKARTLKRHVAAAKRNLKWKGETYSDSQRSVDAAKAEYEKANKSISISRKKRMARIDEASRNLSKAFEMAEVPKSEMERAIKVYNKAADEMWAHNNAMIKKYGKDKVKDIKTTSMTYGKKTEKKSAIFGDEYSAYVIDNLIKTGPTVANIPFIGQHYTGSYVSKEELRDREEKFTKKSRERY